MPAFIEGLKRRLRRLPLTAGESVEEEIVVRVAWVLATHPDPRARDGELAARLAARFVRSGGVHPARAWDTLAAASAERGDMASAKRAVREALDHVGGHGAEESAARVRRRLRMYESGVAYRDESLQVPIAGELSEASQRRAWAHACKLVALELRDQDRKAPAIALLCEAERLDGEYAEIHTLTGRLLLQDGQAEAALRHLAAATHDAKSGDAGTWLDLGMAYQLARRPGRAIACFRKALRRRPGWIRASNNLAWILATHPVEKWRDGEEAFGLLEPLSAASCDKSADVWDTLAAAYAEIGRFDEAVRTADRAWNAALEQGNRRQARGIRMRRLMYEARRPYRDSGPMGLARKVKDQDAHVAMAERLLDQGRLDQAAGHYEAAARRKPGDAEILNDLGAMRLMQHRPAEAVAMFARAARRDPTCVEALVNLVRLRSDLRDARLRDLEEAQLLAGLVRDLDPEAGAAVESVNVASRTGEVNAGQVEARAETSSGDNAAEAGYALAYAELGALALQQGRGRAAERHFKQALNARAEHPELLNNAGLAVMRQGRFEEAAEYYRASLRVRPGQAEVMNNLAWALATQPEVTRQEAAEAVQFAEQACRQREARQPEFLDTLAAAYAAAGRFDEAVRTVEEAMECAEGPALFELRRRSGLYRSGNRYRDDAADVARFAPRYRQMHLRLGIRLAKEGDVEAALRHLRGAQHAQEGADALNDIGMVMLGKGHNDQAIRSFSAALKLRPGWVPAANNLAWTLATRSGPAPPEGAQRAVRLAESVCAATKHNDSRFLDTLAAAYAAAGRFDDALATTDRALDMLPDDQDESTRRAMIERRKLYAAGKPYRGES